MSLKSQYRLERIKQTKEVILKNPELNEKDLILLIQLQFGFSERLVKEYIKIIKFESEIR